MAPSQRPSQPFIYGLFIINVSFICATFCHLETTHCAAAAHACETVKAASAWTASPTRNLNAEERAAIDGKKGMVMNSSRLFPVSQPSPVCVRALLSQRERESERERERERVGARRVGVGRWQADDEQGRGAVGAAGTLLKHRGDSHKRGSYWWTRSRLREGGRVPRWARCLVAGRNR